MLHARAGLFFGLLLIALAPAAARAQGDWAPPSRDMPAMPRQTDLQGDWLSPRASWFRGVDGVSGVAASSLRANAQAVSNGVARMVQFTSGAVPIVVWSDRNGDGRADMIEIFRSGSVVFQLVDADYDGSANVLRVYDSEGKLLRQNPV